MQAKNRVYDKDLRRFIYPNTTTRKREINDQTPYPKNLSFNPIENPKNSYLHYQYNHNPDYFPRRELNQNALGYPRDQGQISTGGNKQTSYPYSYVPNTYKPEGKIYHYSISSKREYNQDLEEDTSSGAPQLNLNLDKKTYIYDSKSKNKYKQFLNRRNEENILPNKVFISETYHYNKENPYKFRPSREKDGNKGGVINLKENNKMTGEDYFKKVVMIQKWWKKYLNNNKMNYERYSSVINRQSFSRSDSNNDTNNSKGNKFIIQTTRVEVFKRQYMCIPLIKPEIITKKNKVNFDKKNDEENLEIILDKDSLKQNMANIWNEENIYTLADSLCIIPDEKSNKENILRSNKIKNYEDEIKKLKMSLAQKEKELNDLSNKLKSMQNKKSLDRKLIKRQLVDNLFINNHRNISLNQNSSIETNDNFEILPMEKRPLEKQIIDSLFILSNSRNLSSIFSNEKTIAEARDNLEILPIEKEPLKKQVVDDLFIEKSFLIKPDNLMQNVDKITIQELNKEQNSIESGHSLEIFPAQKEPLQMQLIDSLFIEKNIQKKPENKIQNIEKMSLFKTKKPQNIYESIDNIEISYIEEEKSLEKQTVDNLFIEKNEVIRPLNKIQNVDELFIFKTKRPQNIIETEYSFELLPKEKTPLQMQLVDGLFIEEMPYIPRFKNLTIEEFDGLTIIHYEKEDLLLQAVDSILIEPLEPKKNEKQQTCLMTILKAPKPLNSIEISESLYIPPKEKAPLKYELINDLFIEENPRPEHILQSLDKIELKEILKTPNIFESIDCINLFEKEKEPLINQEIDKIIIEPMTKPEIKIQSLDKIILSTKPKQNLLIEEKDSILIPQKEKAILDINSIDGLIIEGKSYPIHELQNIHEINLSQKERAKNEISANNEIYIGPKEKEELINQYVDKFYIEQIQKEENKKELVSEFNIDEIARPENIIEANTSLFIPKKEKEVNQNQSIDSILLKSKEKEENKIQPMHKINLDELKKPENFIQKTKDLYIKNKDRIPHEFQTVDNLIIEGYSHDDINLMQKIDDFTIVKVFKLSNRIDKMDSFYIPSRTKEKIRPQTVDSIYITGDFIQYDDNKIQKMDKISILKKPKEPNKIEKNFNFELLFQKKNVLLVQKLDQLMIEKQPKDKEFIFQEVDKIEIKEIQEIQKDLDYVESPNEKIMILGNKKTLENKEITVDNICLESLQKESNKIENVGKFDILKSIKKVENKNIIENKDNIFIPPKEKEKLDIKLVESILIENMKYPENLAQIVDKFEILNMSVPIQQIETKESLYIPPKKKLPLDIKQVEYLLIKGIDLPENKEQNTNSILLEGKIKEGENKNQIEKVNEINLLELNKPENIIEELEGILIKSKAKEELKYEQCDALPIEGKVQEKNEIQKAESIEILKSEKLFINKIEQIESMYIPPKAKPQLKNENIDNILYLEIPKQENQIEPKDKFDILKSPKNKALNYLIESNTNLLIKPKEEQSKKPLELQLTNELVINGLTQPKNEILKLEDILIPNTKKEKIELKNVITNNILLEGINNQQNNSIEQNINLYIEQKKKQPLEYQRVESVNILPSITNGLSKENIIEKNFDFYIQSKEKESLEYQIIDRMLIEGINSQENEIQKALNFMIEKSNKIFELIIPENDTNFFIKPKDKRPLEKQLIDSLFMPKTKKEKNKIEKKDEFFIRDTPKVKEINKKEVKSVIESTCNIFIKPKEKKNLELQNTEKVYIPRLMPKFQPYKCIKEDKDSFNILKSKQEMSKIPLTSLSINNSELFIKSSTLPFKKSAENKIEKMEDINIAPVIIKEDDLINNKNMEEKKINLHAKKKEKIEYIKDRMDSLYFSGNAELKEKKKEENNMTFINLIEKKEGDFIIKKEIKPLTGNIIKENDDNKNEDKTFKNLEEKKESYFVINKETISIPDYLNKEKEEIINEDKTFKNLIPKKENDIIINKIAKPLIMPKNEIKQEESLFIPNKELSKDKLYLLFLEKWKKDRLLIQTIVKFKIDNQKPKEIIPIKKEEKPEKPKQITKLTPIKLKPLNLEGNITPEYFNQLILLRTKYLEKKDKIQPKSEINIYYPKVIKPLEQKQILDLTSTKPESFNLEGNISQKHYQDLFTFKNNYLMKKAQIQISESSSLFLPSQPPKVNENIIPIYSDKTNRQLWIKGKQKKPYIIENKGYFIINSTQRPSKNLIVRGSCFGFMAEPKKPGLVSQDFGIVPIPKDDSKQNWNKLNKQQRSQFFNIIGSDNKIAWNKMIKRQKCVKFNIPPSKMSNNEIIMPEKINNIIILGTKPFDQEIKNEDYNYNSLEKDKEEKQKGVVKSTISRIYREPQLEDSQEEFDPFSCCKKRDTTKYDKIFKERKTSSALMKENNDINSNIISPLKSRPTENIRKKEDNDIKFKDNKERKSDLNLFENKNKNKLKLMNKDNNGPKHHPIFKKKEKKTEYLRDIGAYNDQMYN